MPQLASDTFNRADGDLGANWTNAFDNPPQIVGGVVQATGVIPAIATSVYSAISWPGDQYSVATVVAAATVDAYARLTVRHALASFSGYFLHVQGPLSDAGAPVVALFVVDLVGGLTVLASATPTVNAGDTIKLLAKGNVIIGRLNGIDLFSVVDNTLSAGYPGIAFTVNSGSLPDAKLDAWSGGDLAVPPMPDSPTVGIRYQDYVY